jgi:predicted Zn-dependent peptidase
MVTVRESEVDGVPCFWVETGRPTLAARLLFRQGTADEPLHESGWLHLLEHMALHGTGSGSLHVNGSVSPLITTFETHGPPEAVARHLTRLASWLGDPELRGVERERGVLRAESELRGGPFVNSLRWRYGAQGPGVGSYAEPGLVRATPEVLRERCRRVFNRGNAVLVLDGAPPHRLGLGLADGSFLPPAPAVSVESEFPAAYQESAGLVLSGVVERSQGAGVAASLLEKALRQEVRERAGAAYAPWSGYEPVDADTAVIAAGSDLRPDILPTILEKSLVVLERLRSGAPQGWIEEQVAARLQALRDPYNAMGVALRAGHEVLGDRLPLTYDDLIAETEQTDREQVRRAFDQLHSTLLLGAPAPTKLPKRIPRVEFPITRPWRDTRGHRHRNWPNDGRRFGAGPAGVELIHDHDAQQVLLAEVTALLTWQDGTRHVVGREGWGLTMSPAQWHGGADLTRTMDDRVPSHLHLPLEGDGSGAFRRLSRWKRWSPRLRRSLVSAPGLALLAVVLALVGIIAASRHVAIAAPFVILALLCLIRVPKAYFRGRRRLW